MKKILLSLLTIGAFAAYIAFFKTSGILSAPQDASPVAAPVADSPSPQTGTSSGSTPPQAARGAYKDGTYTGSEADAFYGIIQVEATVQGGKITDVQFLQHPNDRRESIMINSLAMPRLRSEAIAAQSAKVDVVSGATDSSYAFIESLSAALSKAG